MLISYGFLSEGGARGGRGLGRIHNFETLFFVSQSYGFLGENKGGIKCFGTPCSFELTVVWLIEDPEGLGLLQAQGRGGLHQFAHGVP